MTHGRACLRPFCLLIAVSRADHVLIFPAVEDPPRVVAIASKSVNIPVVCAYKSIFEIVTRSSIDCVPSYRDACWA